MTYMEYSLSKATCREREHPQVNMSKPEQSYCPKRYHHAEMLVEDGCCEDFRCQKTTSRCTERSTNWVASGHFFRFTVILYDKLTF